MKKHVSILVFLAIQIIGIEVFSQEGISPYFSNSEALKTSYNSGVLKSLNSSPITNSSTTIRQLQTSGNSLNVVVLNQVGLYNVADISQSKLTQQKVNQLGNENYYSFIDFYNSTPVNFSVLQQGNANSLQIYGSNSFMNGMKISQKSNFKNIVIKNYK